MTSRYRTDSAIYGQLDLDEVFINDPWLVEQFVGAQLLAWGRNDFGQVGIGVVTYYSTPTQIGSFNNWRQVSAGYYNSSGIKTDGTLWAWGDNFYGELGNSTTTPVSSPIQVGARTDWKQISGGFDFNAAVRTDGTLWTWGYNNCGQIGNGSVNVSYSSPIQVGTRTDWKSVACGQYHTVAIRNDGTMWAWGRNDYGQLGNSTVVYYSSPIQVGAGTIWKSVSCGYGHSIAIASNNAAYAFGWNAYGQLGIGSLVNVSSPTIVGLSTGNIFYNWKQISCGLYYSMGVRYDGTIGGWGYDGYGTLGRNATAAAITNPYVLIGQYWKSVACCQHTLSIRTDGTLWAWGGNWTGQLGNGTVTYYSSPIQIGAMTNWKQVSAGTHSLATTFRDL